MKPIVLSVAMRIARTAVRHASDGAVASAAALACAGILLCSHATAAVAGDDDARHILICVAADAPAALAQAAESLAHDAGQVPLLHALIATQGAAGATVVDSASLLGDKAWHRAAVAQVVVIGLPGHDPLLDKAWGYGARITPAERRIQVLGYGDLTGECGWIESGRNPFLHSQRIEINAFDTCLVKLSGTAIAGVLAAVQAFRGGMINGLVPAGPLTRASTSLLDLEPSLEAPPSPPASLGSAQICGWTQCAGQEYRAFIDAGGTEPTRLWRLRYLRPKGWDAIGAPGWLAGPSRLAFGSAVSIAQFADAATAAHVALAIGKGGKALSIAGHPGFELAAAKDEAIDAGEAAPVLVLAHGPLVLLSSLDTQLTGVLVTALRP
jgi:hypothetical protein